MISTDRIRLIAEAARAVAEGEGVTGLALIRRVKAETAVRTRAERKGKDLSKRQVRRRARLRMAASFIPDLAKKIPYRPFGGLIAGAIETTDNLIDTAVDHGNKAQRPALQKIRQDKRYKILAVALAGIGLIYPSLGINPEADAAIIMQIVEALEGLFSE